MSPNGSKSDACLKIDKLLQEADWDLDNKSMEGIEVHVAGSTAIPGVIDRFHAQPFPTHAPVNYLPPTCKADPKPRLGAREWMP